MNGPNPIFAALVIIAGAIGGLFVTLSVLLSSGNSLAHLCFYLLVGGGVLGLLAPRVGVFCRGSSRAPIPTSSSGLPSCLARSAGWT